MRSILAILVRGTRPLTKCPCVSVPPVAHVCPVVATTATVSLVEEVATSSMLWSCVRGVGVSARSARSVVSANTQPQPGSATEAGTQRLLTFVFCSLKGWIGNFGKIRKSVTRVDLGPRSYILGLGHRTETERKTVSMAPRLAQTPARPLDGSRSIGIGDRRPLVASVVA